MDSASVSLCALYDGSRPLTRCGMLNGQTLVKASVNVTP